MIMFRIQLIIGILALWVSSCSGGSNDFATYISNSGLSGDSSSDNSEPSAPAEEPTESLSADNGKASDDDEGIPGYMGDLGTVAATFEADQFVIVAAPGTVTRTSTSNVFITVWQIDSKAIDKDLEVVATGEAANAIFLGSSTLAEDGSFGYVADDPGDGVKLIFAVDTESEPASLSFTSGRADAYGGFFIHKSDNTEDNNNGGNGNDNNRNNNNNRIFQANQSSVVFQNAGDIELKVKGLIASDPALLP